jgi:hypothetical protein
MSLGHNPARTQNAAVNDPSYTVDDFCAAERMSRSMLYKAWAEGWGSRFLLGRRHAAPHYSRQHDLSKCHCMSIAYELSGILVIRTSPHYYVVVLPKMQ